MAHMTDDAMIQKLRRTQPPIKDVQVMGHLEAVIWMTMKAVRENDAARAAELEADGPKGEAGVARTGAQREFDALLERSQQILALFPEEWRKEAAAFLRTGEQA